MEEQLSQLREQRARGRRKVTAVTAGSAVGATALAAAFGVVLAAGHRPNPAPPPTRPVDATTANAAVQTVDEATVAGAVTPAEAPPVVNATTAPAQPPAGSGTTPARIARSSPTTTTHRELQAPAHRPKATGKETAQAPSGAS